MKLGSLIIEGKLLLAPMCEITNLPFRLICKRYGAAVVYTEMVYADAFMQNSSGKRTFFLEEERPFGIQLVGSKINLLAQSAKKIEKNLKPDLIDLNIGCPAYNIIKSGSGSALLANPVKLGQVVSTIVTSVSLPVTCKMRILANEKATLRAARCIEQSGVCALTVHGRTAEQGYSGKSDWEIVSKIKKSLSIPVILNGDITDEQSALKALYDTGCDALMIGRAAIGNPYIFKRINHYLQTGTKLQSQTLTQKIEDLIEILDLCDKYDYRKISTVKRICQNTVKGFKNSKAIKRAISNLTSVPGIKEYLKSLYV